MALKTDYKDAAFEQKKWKLEENSDGTVTPTDMTVYTQEGDPFGANDINTANKEINRLGNTVTAILPASGWSSAAPYSLRLPVSGIKSTDVVKVYPYTPKELAAADIKTRRKLTAMLTDVETEDGYVVFYCGEKKPTGNFTVLLEGVSANG